MTRIYSNMSGDRYWIYWNGILFFSDGDLMRIRLSTKKGQQKPKAGASMFGSYVHSKADDVIPIIKHDGTTKTRKINAAITKVLKQKGYGGYFVKCIFENLLFID
jgi:hypothetical protein